MKRVIVLLLSLALLCGLFAACGDDDFPSEPEPGPEIEYPADVDAGPVRVLVDVDFDTSFTNPSAKEMISKFKEDDKGVWSLKRVTKELGGPTDVTFEYLEPQGVDRDNELTSIRTEIMAGKGPDVFVCTGGFGIATKVKGNGEHTTSQEQGLFQFPRQAMDNGFFLPLDNYIEKAQFMEWDKLTPVIMDAGKNERGQVLLPMTYTFPLTFFHRTDYRHEFSQTRTYDEMLAGNVYERQAAHTTSMNQTVVFRELKAAGKDELGVSEEEYLEYVRTWVELEQEEQQRQAGDERIDFVMQNMGVFVADMEYRDNFEEDEDLTMVPLYCKEGGYGVLVSTFGAVNANTENPSGAFFILDYLLSYEAQRSDLYGLITFNKSVPTYEGLMQKGKGLGANMVDGYWSFTDENYAEYSRLRENIAWARFRTPLEQEFWNPGGTFLYDEENTKSLETLVHESYMRMNMMLAES